mmetsp:Transcript_70480/g.199910  ORF Transcript_70480/g.199910 Transcript_70480/m.199910 type:complete len:82 (+) Transcript_70480:2608-2853(+)
MPMPASLLRCEWGVFGGEPRKPRCCTLGVTTPERRAGVLAPFGELAGGEARGEARGEATGDAPERGVRAKAGDREAMELGG